MRPAMSLILLAAMASAANAQAPTSPDILLVSGDDFYLIRVSDGVPVLLKLDKVVNLGDTPIVPPDDSVRGQVKAWTKAVDDPTIAAAISKAYEEVTKHVESGKFDFNVANLALQSAIALAVSKSDRPAAWDSWRENMTELVRRKRVDGELTAKADQVAFLKDVHAGLNDATEGKAINDDFLQLIINLILALIESFLSNLRK